MPIQKFTRDGKAAKPTAKTKGPLSDVVSEVISPIEQSTEQEVKEPAAVKVASVPEAVDLFLDGRGERLRGEFANLPHMTLVIGNRAVRAVSVEGVGWLVESMSRRGYMFSAVHGIEWDRNPRSLADLGLAFEFSGQKAIQPYGLGAIIGASGGGKTVGMKNLAKQQSERGGSVNYVNVGEPVPESSTDLADILMAIAEAIIGANSGSLLLFDSFKGPLFTTAGSAGKGGIARPFFQDLSDLSSILARYRVVGIGAINFQSDDPVVIKEITEALIGNTVGIFDVVKATGSTISYRHYSRNYINGDRSKEVYEMEKPTFVVVNGDKPSMNDSEVANALQAAFITAPDLNTADIAVKGITRSFFKSKQ